MSDNEKVLDVRSIVLRKYYRTVDIKNTNPIQWSVLGNYDTMEIEHVELPSSSPPLYCLWEKAAGLSIALQGKEKVHMQYALAWAEKEAIESFWERASNAHILVTTVIHTYNIWSSSYEKESFLRKLNEVINNINSNHSLNIRYFVYFSLDCCDAIVFWVADSFSLIMRAIELLYQNIEIRIEDMFSIPAFAKNIDEDKLKKWDEDENHIPSVTISLRSPMLKPAIEISQRIKDTIDATNDTTHKDIQSEIFMSAGQDDILVILRNIRPSILANLYSKNGPLCSNRLVESCVISKTSLCFSTDSDNGASTDSNKHSEDDCAQQYKNDDSTRQYKYAEKLIKISEYMLDSLGWLGWYPALKELLNELNNIEKKRTAHDIYMQEIVCHKTFVDYLVRITSSEDEFVDYGPIAEAIHRYLHGWSQLSFHAMHSEWQLTESFDSNRLYIYPAKLSLMYSAFMTQVVYELYKFDTQKDLCSFFLTPKLDADPQFYPIYVTEKTHHTMLVLGEIPAQKMFNPALLLPILTHEAAHHAGHAIRKREKRARCIILSVVEKYMERFFRCNLKVAEEEWDNIVDHALEVTDKHIQIENNDELYIEAVEDKVQFLLEDKLFGPEGDLFQYITYKLIEPDASNATLRELTEDIHKNKTEEVYNYLQVLHCLYRETFADICMCHLLEMDGLKYLQCFLGQVPLTEEKNNSNVKQVAWLGSPIYAERCIAVLNVINGLEYNNQEELLSILTDYYKKEDNAGLNELINTLIRCVKNEINDARIERRGVKNLTEYLEDCYKSLQQTEKDNGEEDLLKKIYTAFYDKKESVGFSELYKWCFKLIQKHQEHIIQELSRQNTSGFSE